MGIIAGREKFWSALVSGGFVAAVSTLALFGASLLGSCSAADVAAGVTQCGIVDAPDKATIAGAITGLVASLAAAFGAYIATNSTPTNISDPAEPVHPDDFTSTPKE